MLLFCNIEDFLPVLAKFVILYFNSHNDLKAVSEDAYSTHA